MESDWSIRPGNRLRSVTQAIVEVKAYIGEGSQGIVYRVLCNGVPKALKLYIPGSVNNPVAFKKNLQRNIREGAPSSAFLWPEDLVENVPLNGETTFGYIMDLRPERFKGFIEFNKSRPSYRVISSVVLQICSAFRILHSYGKAYQDINNGNFFVDPATGDVLICDNDNAAPEHTNIAVLGTPGYMAPEIVRTKDLPPEQMILPDQQTDRYSLSVLIFTMLCGSGSHPLKGRRWCELELIDKEAIDRLMGTDPVYMFDLNDTSNRPVRNVHQGIYRRWNYIPNYIRAALDQAFAKGLKDPESRLNEYDWQKLFVRLQSDLIRCSCGCEEMQSDEKCHACGRALPPHNYLSLDGCPDYKVPCLPGRTIYRLQFGISRVENACDPILKILKTEKGTVCMQNISGEVIEAYNTRGERMLVANNELIPAFDGIKIRRSEGSLLVQNHK